MKLSNIWRSITKSWKHTSEGWLNTSWDLGYWQQNKMPRQGVVNEVVDACVSTFSQTVAMCPVHHLKEDSNGVITRDYGSNAERVMLYPNSYQTRSQFINDAIRSVYYEGNAYAVALRNQIGTIRSLELLDPRSTRAYTNPDDGEVWYFAAPRDGRNGIQFDSEEARWFPARDILHIRINTGRDPLVGISIVQAAANSIAANSAIVGHQAKFFNNMSRPSGTLYSDEPLTKEQMQQLREAFEQKSTADESGGIPILGHGLKFQSMSLSSQDAQMVEAFGMTVQSISRVFRVPPQMINDNQNSTFSNSESAMTWFLSSGLGFLLEHIELELTKLFDLRFGERLNFNTRVLLRQDWKQRIETLGEGVIKGIYAPNEARALEGMAPVEDGDMPRVQQQVVPLNWDGNDPAPPPSTEEMELTIRKAMKKHAA